MVKNVSEMTYAPVTPDNAKNIVIIGAGGIVSGTHLPAYKIADYPVKAIYDIDFEKAKKVAQENDIPNVFETLEEIIDFGVKNDAVFDIAVPASVLGDILENIPEGSAVLMQKPMGENIEQADRIMKICREKKLTAGVNFQLRQAPYMIAARKLIEDGVIGEIVDIDWRVVELHPWYLWSFLFGLPRMEILYHSIHYIDAIRSIIGDPDKVFSKTMPHPKIENHSQTRTSIIMDYGNTIRVNLHINHCHDYALDYQESTLKIEGLKGAIRITLGLILDYPAGRPDKLEYITDDGKGWREVEIQGSWFPEAFIGTMGGLMKKIEDPDYNYMNSIDEAYKTMCVVESCYESNEIGGLKVKY